jgi:lysozyme family protein
VTDRHPTDERLLDAVLEREGGFRAAVRRPDGSVDPDTNMGITAPVLGAWHGWNRHATVAELKAMPVETARAIYHKKYIGAPGFTETAVPFEPLREQLIDYGINSGPALAVRWLQRVLRQVRPEVGVTGLLDAPTRTALRECRGYLPWVHDAFVAARAYMIDRAVDSGRMRKQDEEGVESRALSFLLATPDTD